MYCTQICQTGSWHRDIRKIANAATGQRFLLVLLFRFYHSGCRWHIPFQMRRAVWLLTLINDVRTPAMTSVFSINSGKTRPSSRELIHYMCALQMLYMEAIAFSNCRIHSKLMQARGCMPSTYSYNMRITITVRSRHIISDKISVLFQLSLYFLVEWRSFAFWAFRPSRSKEQTLRHPQRSSPPLSVYVKTLKLLSTYSESRKVS